MLWDNHGRTFEDQNDLLMKGGIIGIEEADEGAM